jgi:hypothetical protein
LNQVADFPATIDLPQHGLEIPPELRASVKRHEQHLAELVGMLRAAGMSTATIDASVRQLVDSYRDELVVAIRAMFGVAPDA